MIRTKHIRRSLVQFRTHPLRTALALLGMVLGVGSVVGMVSIGEGAQHDILASIEALGGDTVHVKAKEIAEDRIGEIVNDSVGLSRADALALQRAMPSISQSAFARYSDLGVSDLKVATYGVKVAAVDPKAFELHRLELAEGRRLLALDDRYGRRVAVIGAELARDAFPQGALGQRVRLGYAYFEIVGVLKPKRSGGDLPVNPALYNRAVVVPFSTAIEEISPADAYKEVDLLSLKVGSLDQTVRAKKAIAPVLRALHGNKVDFEVIAPEEVLEQKRATQSLLNMVLTCIAAISLLVGGIGVMNIMLANIMERISEIGLRRAIGASRADIREQFLVESVVICSIGGLIGVVLGFAISYAAAFFAGLHAAMAWSAVFLAFGLSLAVGLIFGIWPAVRAASIHPVEALVRQ